MERRHKKFILVSVGLGSALLFLYGVAVHLFFRATNHENLWIRDTIQKKESIASEIKGPRLLVFGGSSVIFGIKASELEKALGMPAVNMGLNKHLGIDYILYRAKRVLRKGDVAVLALEYNHFLYEGDYHPMRSFYIRTYDREYFEGLPMTERLAHIYKTDPVQFVKYIKEQATFDEKAATGYSLFLLNGNGDITSNDDDHKMRYVMRSARPFEIPGGALQETLGLRLIRDFRLWCGENGVTLLLTYANTVKLPEYDSPEYRSYFRALEGYFKAQGIHTLGAPEDAFFGPSLFYDSLYHMNSLGATIRTERLAELIEEALRLPSASQL